MRPTSSKRYNNEPTCEQKHNEHQGGNAILHSLIVSCFLLTKIFLDSLGVEFIGLSGTLYNILSFLNVAELGIGTSITYFLYKPLQENNHDRINEIMSILSYIYRKIGETIFLGGIVISLFFPFIFKEQSVGIFTVYFTFFAF